MEVITKWYTEIRPKSVKELFELLNNYSENFIFRGQTNSNWSLSPSLERLFDGVDLSGDINFHFIERRLKDDFCKKIHLYKDDPSIPNKEKSDLVQWLSIMQHYGAPTRLLDFTHSPYVAAFFAYDTVSSAEEVAIWSINQYGIYKFAKRKFKIIDKIDGNLSWLPQIRINQFVNRIDNDIIQVLEEDKQNFVVQIDPEIPNIRLNIQQGTFLYPLHQSARFEDCLKSNQESDKYIDKIVIPYKWKIKILTDLIKMNITAESLFPGLGGYCKFINYKALTLKNAIEEYK